MEEVNMKYIVKDNEAAFVVKNGQFVKMLRAGQYRFSPFGKYEIKSEELTGEVDYIDVPYEILKKDKAFDEATVKYKVPDDMVGFIYVDGILKGCTTRSEYVFWNVFEKVEVRFYSMKEMEMQKEINKKMLSVLPMKYYTKVVVNEGEVALLYYDQQYTKTLTAGVYYFWNYNKEVTYRIVDQKWKELNVVGQEILTKDKIGIRLNLVCNYRIVDAVAVAFQRLQLENQLYSYVQLVTRELIGNYRLDEILEKKVELSQMLSNRLKQQQEEYFVEFSMTGIKDIILPGEIRDIMNSVLLAEKRAQAKVIERREEVASTRSLLNTAKLMDENKTLYQLKKLEYLERICSQVGEISVAGKGDLVEQLGQLVGTK